ncbi:hypothetical protein AB0L10_41965 [Streptomyces flaveolus]|uniref:hypothetical protein n=1 Tax=Streptomyces flaveolus TaxID=67297 RepID=UPI00343D961C
MARTLTAEERAGLTALVGLPEHLADSAARSAPRRGPVGTPDAHRHGPRPVSSSIPSALNELSSRRTSAGTTARNGPVGHPDTVLASG